MKTVLAVLSGVGVGGVVGATVSFLIGKKVPIYVTTELATYVGSLQNSGIYVAFFDHNKDGVIDLQDLTFFAANVGNWVELQA